VVATFLMGNVAMHDIQALFDQYDATGLAGLVHLGEITQNELLEAAITRLERINPTLNAVAETLYESARSASPVDGPFAGVPTLVKDLFTPMVEARMTNGSLALGEYRPQLDDTLVGRLREAGCRFIGTTTSPEFGISYTTESVRFGATRNPWNPDHSAGGSSGAAAALVAARVVPFAHGNDGAGSLRVPASCCGVFGLKPSRGRMPFGPLTGEGWAGMSTSHAITLSVRDSAALLDITAGSDAGAPYAAPVQNESFVDALSRPPGSLRIALVEHLAPWNSSPQALAAVHHTAKLCEALGHQVEPAVLAVNPVEFYERIYDIIGANTRSYIDFLGDMRGHPINEQEIELRTRLILRERGNVSGARYVDAVAALHTLGRELAHFLTVYDLILTPTVTREPPKIGSLGLIDESFDIPRLAHHFHSYSPFTALFNASGQPAMSVPLYWGPSGLPIGSHFAARFGEENTLLALAAQLEYAQPWAGLIPPVNACSR
jgi:amidase